MKSLAKISLRKATFPDIEFLWYLRNQPDVYKYSRNNKPVKWKGHISWILPIILGIANKDLFVIKNVQTPIGQIRLDFKNPKKAEISISILKKFRDKDFATRALNLAIEEIKKQKKVNLLIAVTHKENIPSQRLFEKLNFRLNKKQNKWLKYILRI